MSVANNDNNKMTTPCWCGPRPTPPHPWCHHCQREIQTVQQFGTVTQDTWALVLILTVLTVERWVTHSFMDLAFPMWKFRPSYIVDHNKLWRILKEMGMPDHLTCLLRNLYAGQEATVRTGHGTTDWFQIGKGVRQGCILLPCLFNLYAEYILRNAGLEEAQAGIKIAGRSINYLRCADDTTLMAEELKSLLMKVKEES